MRPYINWFSVFYDVKYSEIANPNYQCCAAQQDDDVDEDLEVFILYNGEADFPAVKA